MFSCCGIIWLDDDDFREKITKYFNENDLQTIKITEAPNFAGTHLKSVPLSNSNVLCTGKKQ